MAGNLSPNYILGNIHMYTILVIGEWPVLFLEQRELAIFKNVNCEYINSGDW